MVEGNRKIDTHSLINLGIAAMAFTGYVLMGITNNMDPEYVPNLASPTLALAVVVVLLGGAMAYSYSARCAVGAVESTTPPPPAKSNRPKAKSVQYTKPERDLVKDAARKQAARARRKANQKLNPSRSSDRLSDPVPAEDGHKPESAPAVDPMPAWDHDDDMDTGPKQWEKATYDLYGHKGDGPWKTVKIEHHRQVAADDGNETEERKDVKETFTVDQDVAAALIGPKGANIRDYQNMPGVVRIDVDRTTVTVTAENSSALHEVMDRMNLQKTAVSLEHSWMYGWLLADKGSKIRELESACSVRAKIQKDEQQQLILIGTPSGLEDAQNWLSRSLEALSFEVSDAQIGWLLSNKGEQIRGVEEVCGVARVSVDKSSMQIVLYGSARANAAAQSYIELNTFSHVVQLQSPMQITWLRGGKQHLDQLTAIPGLCRVNIKDDDCAVELTGQHQGVMAGLRWFEDHMPPPNEFCVVEFMVEPNLLGAMMGKKGGRLTQIEKENDVFSINVSDDGTVRVLGARLESCNRVKRALQVFSENVDISKAQLRWLMLNKAANLKAMEEACLLSNCHVERLDSGAAVLEMVGTAEVIIKAKVWIDVHLNQDTIEISDLCVGWLLDDKAAALRELEHAASLSSAQVESDSLELHMLGTGDSVELAKEWLAQRCHELLLRVDERGALSLLLQNKATSLKQLKHAAKLGRVSLDKSTCELQLLGEASALEAARAWLKQNTQTHSLVVRDGFVRWIIGRKGAALKTNMQAMEKAAGSLVSVNLDQPTSSIEITGSQSAIDNVLKWIHEHSQNTIEAVNILASQSGWIIGRKGANVKEMIQATGVESVDIDDDTTVLVGGTQEAVQKALLYIECQAGYYTQFHEQEDKISELKTDLSVLPSMQRPFNKSKGKDSAQNQP